MSAPDLGPLDQAPKGFRPPFDEHPPHDPDLNTERWRARRRAERVQALHDALAGIELGAHDERMIAHWAGDDEPTLGTLVSLLLRARQAGPR